MRNNEKFEISVDTLASEIVRRSIRNNAVNKQERSLLAKVEKVCESKKKYLAHVKRDLLALESECENHQTEAKNTEKHIYSLIGNTIHPGLKVKCRLLDQLHSLETEDIENVNESEKKFDKLTDSFLELLQNHTQEKQQETIRELTAEMRQLRTKSQEYDEAIKLMQEKYGLMLINGSVEPKFRYIPGSLAANEKQIIANIQAATKSLQAENEALKAKLELDLEERLNSLRAEVKSLQNNGPFNEDLSDILKN